MTQHHPVKVAKTIIAAEGYLELGMREQALAALESINGAAAFEKLAQFFRQIALSPEPDWERSGTREIWSERSDCYKTAGWEKSAVNAKGKARGAHMPVSPSSEVEEPLA